MGSRETIFPIKNNKVAEDKAGLKLSKIDFNKNLCFSHLFPFHEKATNELDKLNLS